MAMQSQLTGQKLDQDKLKKQTAEGMVGNQLLIQEANDRDYSASDKDVDETLNDMAKQNGLESKDKLLSKLEEQGMKEKEVVSQIKTQVKVEKLISEESGDTEPTEEELQKAYDQWKSQQEKAKEGNKGEKEDGEEKKIASFDEKKSDLKSQLKTQKKIKHGRRLLRNSVKMPMSPLIYSRKNQGPLRILVFFCLFCSRTWSDSCNNDRIDCSQQSLHLFLRTNRNAHVIGSCGVLKMPD